MRIGLFLIFLCLFAIVLQLGVFPALIPHLLQPDIGILLAIPVLAFATREHGLIAVFALGVQADLFGSARFGLLTLCYMLAAGLILWLAWRELTRGDLLAPWLGSVAATCLAHLLYVLVGRICGLQVPIGTALVNIGSLTVAAVVWGLFFAWFCGKCMNTLGLLSPAVRERWSVDERIASARRGKVMRA